MNDSLQQQAGAALPVLAALRGAFDAGLRALALTCSTDGKLDHRKLDKQQVASFELAWAAADLLAAETGVHALVPDSSELQARLALVFAVDAVVSVFDKLETVYLEAALDTAPLQATQA